MPRQERFAIKPCLAQDAGQTDWALGPGVRPAGGERRTGAAVADGAGSGAPNGLCLSSFHRRGEPLPERETGGQVFWFGAAGAVERIATSSRPHHQGRRWVDAHATGGSRPAGHPQAKPLARMLATHGSPQGKSQGAGGGSPEVGGDSVSDVEEGSHLPRVSARRGSVGEWAR